MNFNEHSHLAGKHSFLSPSQNSWVNYTPEKLEKTFRNSKAKEEGTKLHELASDLINRKIKIISDRTSFDMFVNDAIDYGMYSEVILYYSEFCFGTADAILQEGNLLRISDYKSGLSPVNERQLMIYAALYCLEYGVDPLTLDYELRIYQYDTVIRHEATGSDIMVYMDKIIESDKILSLIDGGIYGTHI